MRMIASSLLCVAVLACPGSGSWAADCPGNPDAIGTSRVLTVDPVELPRIGTVQFETTLPLKDREVVLSFDDGPSPGSTDAILNELASQCVKAVFFSMGRMANRSPEILRRVRDAGHTIGTHTQTHPHLAQLSFEDAKKEIDQGIASVHAALKDRDTAAPFIRAPYLETTTLIDGYLISRGLMLWGIDVDSDDWMLLTPEAVITRAIHRLEKKGRGVILMHDIQERTATALPELLKELKSRGFRIVQVVPQQDTYIARMVRMGIARVRYLHYLAIDAFTRLSRTVKAKGLEIIKARFLAISMPGGADVEVTSALGASRLLPDAAAASEASPALQAPPALQPAAESKPPAKSQPAPEPVADAESPLNPEPLAAPAAVNVAAPEPATPITVSATRATATTTQATAVAPAPPAAASTVSAQAATAEKAATPEKAAVAEKQAAAKGTAPACGSDAIGTSRTLAIDWKDYKRIGSIQFPRELLPLEDHELVLTFDDGPMSPYTDKVLDALAAHCAKATFFVVGTLATDSPDLLQRARKEGHTIGTMTENHYELKNLPAEEVQKEIADGIASSKEALGNIGAPAPFFRDPFLQTTGAVENYLKSQRLIFWSADFDAADWKNISPDEVVKRALASIEGGRKGILELHDIQERTALALPKLLTELKRRGYRIVHVVPKEM